MTLEEIERIEEEIRKTPYNKATQKHIGMLKAKLAKLRASEESKGGKRGAGYSVRKSGDATVILVGFPSVGKSTLLNSITRADSKIAEYEFTTLNVIPGVLEFNSAKIQILDIPGIIEGVASGKGRGKEILSVVRSADLILIMVDPKTIDKVGGMKKELYDAGFRLDQKKPDVRIEKRNTGGLRIEATKKLKLKKETIRSIFNEFSIYNAEILIRGNINEDQLIDCIIKNRAYVKSIVIVNKMDILPGSELREIKNKHKDYIFISAKNKENLEKVKENIWNKLELMRVYMKRIGKEPDLKEPLIIKKGSNVLDVANKIHNVAFGENVEYARIWGPSARFEGQKKGVNHILKDKDIVELHFR